MLTELYVPGTSPLHRTPPQYMVLALVVFCTALFLLDGWLPLAIAAALVLVAYLVADLRLRHAVAALRPVFWVLVIIFAVHVVMNDVGHAALVVARFILMILAASVVTLTTRTSEFVEGIRALLKYAPSWIPKDRIALAIALTIRFIPSIRKTLAQVRMAQKARGLERSLTATLVPLVVNTLKSADQIAAALEARTPEDRDTPQASERAT